MVVTFSLNYKIRKVGAFNIYNIYFLHGIIYKGKKKKKKKLYIQSYPQNHRRGETPLYIYVNLS